MTEGGTLATTNRVFGMVRRRRPGHLGLDPFYTELLEGLESVLAESDSHIIVHIVPSEADEMAAYQRWSEGNVVEAVVLSDLTDDDSRAQLCEELGLPAVFVGGPLREGSAVVQVDNQSPMSVALEFLADLGHRRIGRITGPSEFLHTRVRTLAFEACIANLGLQGYQFTGDYGAASGERLARELLTRHPDVTAILCDNDVMAEAAATAVLALGRRVPEDVSILAWDDSSVCQLASPTISALVRQGNSLGECLGRALIDPAHVDLRPLAKQAVIGRESTGSAPH